jgi:hypothetical protein
MKKLTDSYGQFSTNAEFLMERNQPGCALLLEEYATMLSGYLVE